MIATFFSENYVKSLLLKSTVTALIKVDKRKFVLLDKNLKHY